MTTTETSHLPAPAQLGLILHRMLVDLRTMNYEDEMDVKQLAEVTDLAELIPLQFMNRHEGYLEIIAVGLRELAARYPSAGRYAAVLDMAPDEVRASVAPTNPQLAMLTAQGAN